jgi:hypothetical protein
MDEMDEVTWQAFSAVYSAYGVLLGALYDLRSRLDDGTLRMVALDVRRTAEAFEAELQRRVDSKGS